MKSKAVFRFMVFITAVVLLAGCVKGGGTTTPPATANLSASLSELKGLVELWNPNQPDFSAAVEGNNIQVQGKVRTGVDGRTRLDLSTGSIIRIASSTLFVLESNQEQNTGLLTRLKIEAGKLWVILNGGQMEIETPSGLATVRGSFMSVWVDPLTSDVWVTCLEGWCRAENPTATLDLVAGEGATLYSWDPAGTLPPPPPELRYLTQADINDFLANNPEAQDVLNAVIATASALPTLTPSATSTSTPTLTPTSTPTLTSTFTSIPTATTPSCSSLLSPADGTDFPGDAKASFTWTDYPGTSLYTLTLKVPSGSLLNFDTSAPSDVRFIESFQEGGTYQWWVTVKNDLGTICTSQTFSFTKPETIPTLTPTSAPGEESGNPLFWGRSGPKGKQDSCSELKFSVTTSLTGTIMVMYSQINTSPNGNDSDAELGPGPGTGNGTISFYGNTSGESVYYWRFAVYGNDGVYTYDSKVYTFSCGGVP